MSETRLLLLKGSISYMKMCRLLIHCQQWARLFEWHIPFVVFLRQNAGSPNLMFTARCLAVEKASRWSLHSQLHLALSREIEQRRILNLDTFTIFVVVWIEFFTLAFLRLESLRAL